MVFVAAELLRTLASGYCPREYGKAYIYTYADEVNGHI